MKNLFRRVKRVTPMVKVPTRDRIAHCQDKVSGALAMFKKADKALTEANAELSAVIQKEQKEIKERQAQIEKAQAEVQANNALKARLSDFVPQ